MAENTFVAGETLTYVTDRKQQPMLVFISSFQIPEKVDFMFWEMLDQMNLFDEKLFNECKNLLAFKNHFEALPKVGVSKFLFELGLW